MRTQSGGNVAIDVTVKVTLVWSGSGTPTTPPQSVKIIADASGYSATSGTGATPAPEANNGFDGAQMQPMMQNSNNGPVSYGTSAQSHGTHLVKVPAGSSATTIDVGTYTMRAFGFSGGFVLQSASVNFEAAADTRTVSISREGARSEFQDSDGTIHGDTVYSARRTTAPANSGNFYTEDGLNWQVFHSYLFSDWGSGTTGIWSPAYSGATLDWNLWSMPYGDVSYWNDVPIGSPTNPTQRALTFTATDPVDGASATAAYLMTIHDRIEVLTHNVDNSITKNIRPAGSPDVRNEGGTDIEVPGGYLELSDSYSIGFEVSIDPTVSIWVASLGHISLSYTITLNAGQQASPITLHPGTYT